MEDDVMRKVAIITGASSGIGREFALQIAQRYRTIDEIWLIARRKDRLAEVKTEINAVSGKLVRILALDLTDETDIKFYRNLLERQAPSIRVLVNAAGYGIAGHFENMTVDDVNVESQLQGAGCHNTYISAIYVRPFKYNQSCFICSFSASAIICYICGIQINGAELFKST